MIFGHLRLQEFKRKSWNQYTETETERPSGWELWYSLKMLKTSYNVSNEYQGCHLDDRYI